MKISRTNIYTTNQTSMTVDSDADSLQDITNVNTGDFSTAYTSAGTASAFNFAANLSGGTINYVAVAGHTYGSGGGGTLRLIINGTIIENVTFAAGSKNDVIMFTFDQVDVATSIRLLFFKNIDADKVTVTYVSAGITLSLGSQNSEPGGYSRNWLTDSKRVRAQVNDAGAPVAYIRERIARQATLNIDNVNISVTNANQWRQFLDRVYEQGDFFIKENDGLNLADNPLSSYMCFDAQVAPPKAHPDTRQLNNLQITFKTYTGH